MNSNNEQQLGIETSSQFGVSLQFDKILLLTPEVMLAATLLC
jgi:hypothetical protein